MSTQNEYPSFPVLTTLIALGWILAAPFFAVGWAIYGLSLCVISTGEIILETTTSRLWEIRHHKRCAVYFAARKRGGEM